MFKLPQSLNINSYVPFKSFVPLPGPIPAIHILIWLTIIAHLSPGFHVRIFTIIPFIILHHPHNLKHLHSLKNLLSKYNQASVVVEPLMPLFYRVIKSHNDKVEARLIRKADPVIIYFRPVISYDAGEENGNDCDID